jgi:hypothetical protein
MARAEEWPPDQEPPSDQEGGEHDHRIHKVGAVRRFATQPRANQDHVDYRGHTAEARDR